MIDTDDLIINRIYKIVQNNSDIIIGDSNIIGIGVGNKIINNTFTDIPTLTVIVNKKLTGSNLNYTRKIPKFVYGILTDVIESEPIKLTNNRVKPALGGVSIGNERRETYGTLAYAVTDVKFASQLYALSCDHVISYYSQGAGEKNVIQPGKMIGELVNYYQLGKYTKGVKIKPGIPKNERDYNEVDAAIAYVGPNNDRTKETLLEPLLLDRREVKIMTTVKPRDEVMKIGAETQRTFGQVLTVGTSIRIKIDGEETAFKNQITTNMLTGDGDSGALGISIKNWGTFGMLMGNGGKALAYFNPIQKVMELLDVKLA